MDEETIGEDIMAKLANLGHFLIPLILIVALILGAGCMSSPNVSFSVAINETSKATLSESNALYPPPGVSEVIAKVRPSVVSVSTEQVAGSGWILDKDGLIVTNNHVVEGAKTVTVTLENGQTFPAKTILTDAIDDLAVIDIGISDLSAATIGDSSKMRVGDLVMAMGNARGEGICTTQGAICSTGLAFTVGARETLYNTLGTTAPITYGNSGGPLVNMDGEVIGIVTAAELTWAGTQVAGYAISSDTAQQVIRDLTQRGYVPRAWLGIKVSNVTDLPTRGWKLPVEKGAFVIQVDAQSPAGQAGLKAGDVIVTFGERNISTVDDLVTAVRATEIGQQVKTTYWRDNNENTVTANLVQDPAH